MSLRENQAVRLLTSLQPHVPAEARIPTHLLVSGLSNLDAGEFAAVAGLMQAIVEGGTTGFRWDATDAERDRAERLALPVNKAVREHGAHTRAGALRLSAKSAEGAQLRQQIAGDAQVRWEDGQMRPEAREFFEQERRSLHRDLMTGQALSASNVAVISPKPTDRGRMVRGLADTIREAGRMAALEGPAALAKFRSEMEAALAEAQKRKAGRKTREGGGRAPTKQPGAKKTSAAGKKAATGKKAAPKKKAQAAKKPARRTKGQSGTTSGFTVAGAPAGTGLPAGRFVPVKPGVLMGGRWVVIDPAHLFDDAAWQATGVHGWPDTFGALHAGGTVIPVAPVGGDGTFTIRVGSAVAGRVPVDTGTLALLPVSVLDQWPKLKTWIGRLVKDGRAVVVTIKGGPIRWSPRQGMLQAGDLSVSDRQQ